MDPKLFKKILSDNPSEEEYVYWKKMMHVFIEKAKIEKHDYLSTLFLLCGAGSYSHISDCTSFEKAVEILDKRYVKTSSAIMQRYSLLKRQQRENESLEDYMNELKCLSRKCSITPLTKAEATEQLLSDAFIIGLKSPTLRQRLLESTNSSLDHLYKLALTFEQAEKETLIISRENRNMINAEVKELSAIRRNCMWCGKSPRHDRQNCPAKNSVCAKCGKNGHWANSCLSKRIFSNKSTSSSAIQMYPQGHIHDNTETDGENSIMSVLAGTSGDKIPLKVHAKINGIDIQTLIDTGSDMTIISSKFLISNNLSYTTYQQQLRLADKSVCQIIGKFYGSLTLENHTYNSTIFVMKDMVTPLIIGMDILKMHDKVIISMGGNQPPLSLCLGLQSMKCQPFELLPGIDTSKLKPIATPNRSAGRDENFVKCEIERLLKEGIICESQSPWRAQCFVAKQNKPRLVIDYSQTINIHSPIDSYPIPDVQDLLHKVGKNKIFSKVDLKSAYHQIPLRKCDQSLTAFQACGRLFEFTKLPFGCTNAVPIFQRTMDRFIDENDLKETYAYLDDIIIGGKDKSEHDDNLKYFMKAASECGMTINTDKCQFGQESISFLGHFITNGTLKPDPERFKSLLEFPLPSTVKQLNRLVGLFAYYAKWIPKCSEIIKPLTEAKSSLAAKESLPQQAIDAIEKLKDLLIRSSLSIPDQTKNMTLETDASDIALGASLTQDGRPVAFFSRVLSQTEKHYPVMEKEAAAIVESCKRWRHLLHMVPQFMILTDQKAVSFLFDTQHKSKIKNEKIIRWRNELSDLRFNISHKPGSENIAADALSRCGSIKDEKCLETLHSRLGHPGITRFTHYCRSKNLPYTVSEIRTLTNSCQICQELKPKFYKPPMGKLIHASRPWERLSIDFIGPMPSNTQNKYLLTIVDEYSRFPFAYPCSRITSDVVIKHLLDLFSVFGCPSSVHSDRGSQFESREFKNFLLNNGIIKTHTTPYRPQANGQCERVNGLIQRTLSLHLKTHGFHENQWEKVLPTALSSIRTLLCTATNSTPHDRLLNFQRSSTVGISLPDFLLQEGNIILYKNHIRNKGDPLVKKCKLIEILSPYFAKIQLPNGKEDVVSTRHLAPSTQNEWTEDDESDIDDVLENQQESYEQDQNDQPQQINNNDTIDTHSPCSSSGRKLLQPVRYGFS